MNSINILETFYVLRLCFLFDNKLLTILASYNKDDQNIIMKFVFFQLFFLFTVAFRNFDILNYH